MSVTVTFSGWLGANLFQYALGRLIAEHHDSQFVCQPQALSDRAQALHLQRHGPCVFGDVQWLFPNAPSVVAGHEVDGPTERHELATGSGWDGQTIDLRRVFACATSRHVRLQGYFQRWEYYEDAFPRIRRWVQPLESNDSPIRFASDDVLVSVRRGADYGACGWVLPARYYTDALSRMKHVGAVHVCGVGIDDGLREALASYQPVYHDVPAAARFGLIMASNRIILANDVCAWWPAFLSAATEIVGPRSAAGVDCMAFSGFRNVDLHMRGSRYVETTVWATAAGDVALRPTRNGVQALWDERGQTLYFADAPSVGFPTLKRDEYSSFEWLVRQTHPVYLSDVQRRFPTTNVKQVASLLASAGILAGDYVFHEPRP